MADFRRRFGAKGPRVANAYATVMSAWAMLEAARIEATPELVAARTRALQWIRRSLADIADPNAVRRVPGLAEEAIWVLWQGHRLASDSAPEDTALAASVAQDILARCAPVTSPSFRCGQENFENGSVVLEGPEATEPTTLELFWLPWALLAASEVSADWTVPFDEGTRGTLHAMSLWARTYLSEMRVSILRENAPMFGEFLFALGQTLDKGVEARLTAPVAYAGPALPDVQRTATGAGCRVRVGLFVRAASGSDSTMLSSRTSQSPLLSRFTVTCPRSIVS